MKPIKEKLFYWDCEWVPVSKTINDLKEEHPELYDIFLHQIEKWADKTPGISMSLTQWWEQKAHMYPEFCKIITISYGYFNKGDFIINSLYGDNEKKIMEEASGLFDKVSQHGYILAGAGIVRFDMPWLAKRMMANGVNPPKNLNVYGKKPWDVNVYDILEVWGQGCKAESYTPFEMICISLGINHSKDDISGKDVCKCYYNNEIERIKNYCEKDVLQLKECAVRLIELS